MSISIRNSRSRCAFVHAAGGVLGLLLSVPAMAVDGVIEINQAKALAGNVTPGDGGGFPVVLLQSGSFRLTSDLSAAPGLDGIIVSANDITIDLNGFSLIGAGGPISDGIGLSGFRNIEIRNGTVRGFSRHGIFSNVNTHFIRVINVRTVGHTFSGLELQGGGNLVDGCTALANNSIGIRVGDGSLVVNSVARGNGGLGIVMTANVGFRSNVLTDNNGGNGFGQTAGGMQLGSNLCGSNLTCP